MNKIPLYVGLATRSRFKCASSMINLECCSTAAAATDWREIAAAITPLGGVVKRAGIESCTGAADLAEELATHARWAMDLAHPGYVARLKQTRRRAPPSPSDKSDFTDARLVADLQRTGYLPRVWLAPREA